jgi:hypothetical protein
MSMNAIWFVFQGAHEFKHTWMKDDMSRTPVELCEGGVCVCCGSHPPGEGPGNLIDGNPGTKSLLMALRMEGDKYIGTFTIMKNDTVARVSDTPPPPPHTHAHTHRTHTPPPPHAPARARI